MGNYRCRERFSLKQIFLRTVVLMTCFAIQAVKKTILLSEIFHAGQKSSFKLIFMNFILKLLQINRNSFEG